MPRGAAGPLLLTLLCSGAAFGTPDARRESHRDPTASRTLTGQSHRQVSLLEKTYPFVMVEGQRRTLSNALQDGHPRHLCCGLDIEGRLLLLDLEKNQDLLPRPPNIFYYLPNGTGVSMSTAPVTNCYYHGSVRGYPHSRVALSTCFGLRGIITLNSTHSFELQPMVDGSEREGSGGSTDEDEAHLLFSIGPLESYGAEGCGVTNKTILPSHSSLPPHRRKRDILTETKYIELVLVVDHQEFLNYQKNNKTIIYRMVDVTNQVDWFYRPLNVRVALTGLEIWSDRNKIHIDKSPTTTLNNFLDWRMRELLPRLRHDNAQLVMGEAFDGTTVGMASQSSMCSRDRSGGVNVDHLVSVLGVASTIAHELGHNLGMNHDTAERHCSCQNERRLGGCIMEPSTGFMPGQQFSSCSAADLSVSLLHGGGMCLFNVPHLEQLLGGPRCGNMYVEKGEECDCGLLEECEDPCCNASTCQLVPGAQCSSDGICCHNCKLKVAGSVCREPIGDCDLPEFCTGTSAHCPPNVFVQNGKPCKDGIFYCYGGVCASIHEQCQMLWGPGASGAPGVCFSSVNKQGNKYGNCGQLSNGSYVPCRDADVHCGRIQCQGGQDHPLLGTNAEILTTEVRFNHSDLVCRGTFFHLGDDVSDPATVAQGTACGPAKACLDQRCQDVSVFGVAECSSKCNGHGVCNSNKNCHCDIGWAPPDCLYAGHGGSVDSGPAQASGESYPVRVALLVVFLLIVPLVLLLLAIRFPQIRRSCFCLNRKPFSKVRHHNRVPATERVDGRSREHIRSLRYQLNPQVEIQLTPPAREVHDRPAPPTKPLPPDPAFNPSQQWIKWCLPPPNKPLPPNPTPAQTNQLMARPATPTKHPPHKPTTSAQSGPPFKSALPKRPVVRPDSHPPSPPGCAVNSSTLQHSSVAPSVPPNRHAPPPPPPPSRPAAPPKVNPSLLL